MTAMPALTGALAMALTMPVPTWSSNAYRDRAGSTKGMQSKRTRKVRRRTKIAKASRRANRR